MSDEVVKIDNGDLVFLIKKELEKKGIKKVRLMRFWDLKCLKKKN